MAQGQADDGVWVVVGASRGIGLEFVRNLLEQRASPPSSTCNYASVKVIAAVRNPDKASLLRDLVQSLGAESRCLIETCDVSDDSSISSFAKVMKSYIDGGMRVGTIVLNAGILQYPNRATEVSFSDFAKHLHTNTVGPIVCAGKLLKLSLPPIKLVFISSDSGSTTNFLSYEDGFAAYGASKAALNQALRHMAAELRRSDDPSKKQTTVLALHPGEVKTDMASGELGWEVKGQITPAESVAAMMNVITAKSPEDSGTFWCWDGRSHPW